jgi:hypothetical protein
MDNKTVKLVLDLHEYLDSLGEDRPKVGVILKALNIDPVTMSDCIKATDASCCVALPDYRIQLINHLFKLGITIGYKYAVKTEMERQFSTSDSAKEGDFNG